MPIPEVSLNGVRYRIKGPVKRFKVKPEASAIRTVGQQRLEGLTARSSFVFPAPIYGLGLNRIESRDIDKPHKFGRMADSTLDTRFALRTLPLLAQDSTEPTLASWNFRLIRVTETFKNDIWCLAEFDDSPGANYRIEARKYTGSSTSWTGGGNLGPVTVSVALDLKAHGNYLVALVANLNDHLVYRSTDGVTWSAATTQIAANRLSNNVTWGENIDAGKLVSFGADIYAFYWDEVNQRVLISKSTNSGDVWTDLSLEVSSASGVKGAAVYYDLNGDPAPVFATENALYALDVSGPTVQKLLDLFPSNGDNGRGMATWSNPYNPAGQSLYFGMGNGDILEYTWSGGSAGYAIVRNVGPNKDDGLPSTRQGYVTGPMAGSSQWLFYPYGGHAASRQASVFAWNGMGTRVELDGCGHHHMTQHGTANRKIDWIALSERDDGTPRLHFFVRTGTTAGDSQFQEEPLVSPQSGVSRRYEVSGTMDRPEFDGGMPRDSAAWLALFYNARNLGQATTQEYIAMNYGVDGATPSTSLGNIEDAADGTLVRELSFASGAGVSGRSIQIRETYNRRTDVNTNSPRGGDLELMYLKKVASLDGFVFTVDVENMHVEETRPTRDTISNLETAESSVPLVTFSYGDLSTRYVRVESITWLDERGSVITEADSLPSKVREALVEVREVL